MVGHRLDLAPRTVPPGVERLAEGGARESQAAPIETVDSAGVDAKATGLLEEEDFGEPADQEVLQTRALDRDRDAAVRADRGAIPREIEQSQGGMLEQLPQRPD